MFIISLNYIKSIPDVERLIPAHRKFLEHFYGSGHFLLSGRKEPCDGGIIIAQAENRSEIKNIIREDPFWKEQMADYQITEFSPTMTAKSLLHLKV
jgi:uncharacterized protein YciI